MKKRIINKTEVIVPMINLAVTRELGVAEGLMYQNIYYWCKKNETNGEHFYDGRYWMFNSRKAFKVQFDFWSDKQIYNILSKLIASGYLVKGNYNRLKIDKTNWYALGDKSA